MQHVINDGFTQKSTISVSCPSPVGSNGSSKSFLHASDDFVDLVLLNGVPFNDERIFQFLQRVEWMMTSRIRLFSMSETCSIGARSGERLGLGMIFNALLWCRSCAEAIGLSFSRTMLVHTSFVSPWTFYRPTMLTHYPGRVVLLIWLLSNMFRTC
jgi:hypothetical protein